MPSIFQDEITQITPELRERLKRNYFFANKAQLPSWFASNMLLAYLLIGLAIFFLIYFEMVFWTYIFAFIFISLAFMLIFNWIKPYYEQKNNYSLRPTHTIIEKWLIEDILKVVKPKAIEMLSLNPLTITPENFIIVPYPIYWQVAGVDANNIKRIEVDKYFNYSTHFVQVLALTQNYISYYCCVFDWINNNTIVNANTLEFFYEDISSIRVEMHKIQNRLINAPEKVEGETEDFSAANSQVVAIRNKSGESIEVTVVLPKLQYTPRITLKTEKVMQTLRIMLRNRRFGEEYQIFKQENTQNQ